MRTNRWWQTLLFILPLILGGCGYKRKNFFRRVKNGDINKLTLPCVSNLLLTDQTLTWDPVHHKHLSGYALYASHRQRKFICITTISSEEHSYLIPQEDSYERYALVCVYTINGVKREGPFSSFVINK